MVSTCHFPMSALIGATSFDLLLSLHFYDCIAISRHGSDPKLCLGPRARNLGFRQGGIQLRLVGGVHACEGALVSETSTRTVSTPWAVQNSLEYEASMN